MTVPVSRASIPAWSRPEGQASIRGDTHAAHQRSDLSSANARLRNCARALVELGIVGFVAAANLDLVRSIYAAWERGDYSSARWAHPEIKYVIADGPAPGTWTGPRGMAEAVRDGLNAWENLRPEPVEYRALDGERVLVLVTYVGRGKTSGLDLGQMRAKGAMLFHIRDGMVTRHVHYWDRERALTDLGLAPPLD